MAAATAHTGPPVSPWADDEEDLASDRSRCAAVLLPDSTCAFNAETSARAARSCCRAFSAVAPRYPPTATTMIAAPSNHSPHGRGARRAPGSGAIVRREQPRELGDCGVDQCKSRDVGSLGAAIWI